MADYHVGCGAFGIYAGTLEPKNKNLWRNKTDVTDEAIGAVRDWLVLDCLGGFDCTKGKYGGYQWKLKDGRIVKLSVAIEEVENKEAEVEVKEAEKENKEVEVE